MSRRLNIQERTAYVTEDGLHFLTWPEAERHALQLHAMCDVRAVVGLFYFSGMTEDELILELINNSEDLKKVLP